MPRPTPSDRAEKLIEVAAGVFVEFGYLRAQMDDVAERLGVSKGTVYRTIDSKDTLLAAVLTYGDDPSRLPPSGPIESIDLETVGQSLRPQLARANTRLELSRLATGKQRAAPTRGAAAMEVARVAAELFDTMTQHRVRIMVLDRCAAEVPTLGSWFDQGRYAVVDLWDAYLGQIENLIDPNIDRAALARTIVELITLWAVKMPWDPAPRPAPTDPAAACAAMVTNLVLGGST